MIGGKDLFHALAFLAELLCRLDVGENVHFIPEKEEKEEREFQGVAANNCILIVRTFL